MAAARTPSTEGRRKDSIIKLVEAKDARPGCDLLTIWPGLLAESLGILQCQACSFTQPSCGSTHQSYMLEDCVRPSSEDLTQAFGAIEVLELLSQKCLRHVYDPSSTIPFFLWSSHCPLSLVFPTDFLQCLRSFDSHPSHSLLLFLPRCAASSPSSHWSLPPRPKETAGLMVPAETLRVALAAS